MLFDVQTALAKVLSEQSLAAIPAISAIPSANPHAESQESRESQQVVAETKNREKHVSAATTQPETNVFRHGRSVIGDPKTWTGRVVTFDDWGRLTEWDKHGPDGRHWNGKTAQWEPPG